MNILVSVKDVQMSLECQEGDGDEEKDEEDVLLVKHGMSRTVIPSSETWEQHLTLFIIIIHFSKFLL